MVRNSTNVIVACVRTGTRYGFEYVTKLRNMAARHMRNHAFYCLTDQPERCEGATFVDIAALGLPGWWGKMALFEPQWREGADVIFFDLDTVLVGDLAPLTGVPGEFAILDSPVRAMGVKSYPCKYNSSVMVLGANRAAFVWVRFEKQATHYMSKHETYGDQAAIQEIAPYASSLNRLMPKGFFLNYRELSSRQPDGAAVINFGGTHKPDNCPIQWVQEAWT